MTIEFGLLCFKCWSPEKECKCTFSPSERTGQIMGRRKPGGKWRPQVGQYGKLGAEPTEYSPEDIEALKSKYPDWFA